MASICVTALTGLNNEENKRRGEGNLIRREDSGARQTIQIAAVDTGNNKNSEIAEVLCRSKIQILVLTHDDDDHIKGAEHVLKNSPEAIQELWIPAYWMMQNQILNQLATSHPRANSHNEEIEAALGFAKIVISRGADCFEAGAFKRIFDLSAVVRSYRTEGMRDSDMPIEFADFYEYLDSQRRVAQSAFSDDHIENGLLDALDRLRSEGISPKQMLTGQNHSDGNSASPTSRRGIQELAKRTKDRIKTIDRIIGAALARKTVIRCFLPVADANLRTAGGAVLPAWKTSGHPEFLTIINAVEVVVRRPRIFHIQALFLTLATVQGLSRQNRCALVSFVWPTRGDSEDGFIIWSDSSGEWMHIPRFSVPWEQVGGMTAPHHGSDNCAHAPIWAELAKEKGSTRIIVSGDLSEVKGARARADIIHSIFVASKAKEYGAVHCLDPKARNKFPRAEVHYSSISRRCCLSCSWCVCGGMFQVSRPHTEVSISPFAPDCSPGCLGCTK